MFLGDATDRAAVDLFLRTLSFPFPTRDLVGIPPDFIGLPMPYEEEDCALWIHELEHLDQLTFPLGGFLTALGLRILELRNEAVLKFNDFQDEFMQQRHDPEFNSETHFKAVDAASRAVKLAKFTSLVVTTMELITPLLEGLAMAAEMEIETDLVSRIRLQATTLNFLHLLYMKMMEGTDVQALFAQPAGIQNVFLQLFDGLENQIANSRRLRLEGDLVPRMFLRNLEDPNPAAASPYFCGYLILRRLYQEWSRRVPELEFPDFTAIAKTLFCTVIPLSILPIYSISDFDDSYPSKHLPSIVNDILEGALAFTRTDIELLRDSELLICWDLEEGKLKPWYTPDQHDAGTAEEASIYHEHQNHILAALLVYIYEARDVDSLEMGSTLDLIREVEQAKFLIRTAALNVLVIGVDEDSNVVFLADPTRIRSEGQEKETNRSFDSEGATFFRFEGSATFKQFLDLVDAPDAPLPRMRMGETPYRLDLSRDLRRPVLAQLQTFCFFWPQGLSQTRKSNLEELPGLPVDVIRTLVVEADLKQIYLPHSEPPEEKDVRLEEGRELVHTAFLSTLAGRPIENLPNIVHMRDYINKVMLESLDRMLTLDHEDPRYVWHNIEALYEIFDKEDSFPRTLASNMLDLYPPQELLEVQRSCRSIYNALLFPRATVESQATLPELKLETMADVLVKEDMKRLRRWLRGGLVVSPSRAYEVFKGPDTTDAARSAVARIRSAASKKLGIPLLEWKEKPPQVLLDLIPI